MERPEIGLDEGIDLAVQTRLDLYTELDRVQDAARKIKSRLEDAQYTDYWLRINHYESLHAHDAVAIAVKGIEDGYQP